MIAIIDPFNWMSIYINVVNVAVAGVVEIFLSIPIMTEIDSMKIAKSTLKKMISSVVIRAIIFVIRTNRMNGWDASDVAMNQKIIGL